MKVKHILLIALWLSAVCSLFTACNDDEQPWNPEISDSEDLLIAGKGQFFVSYGTMDDAFTRALSDNKLAPNERISSLHYFVYDKGTGNLIKKRQIRGIGPNTHWPIGNRDSMSWELRQDLQDTLMSGPTYRILFIANIDSTLFGEKHPSVFRDIEKYESAKILLPQVPFRDNNMYYLWEDSLKADANTTIKRNDVLLRRLVTRTDVKRIKIPDLDKYLGDLIAKDLYVEETINTAFNKHLDNFCTDLDTKMTGIAKVYQDHAKKMATYLRRIEVRKQLYNSFKSKVTEKYITAIKAGSFKDRTKDWSLVKSVKLNYLSKSRYNALSFDREGLYLDDWNVQSEEELPIENGRFSIVSFWGHSQGFNELQLMDFSDGKTSMFQLNATSFPKIKDMNRWYNVTCNPIAKVKVEEETAMYNEDIDIEEILKNDQEWLTLLKYKEGLYPFYYYVKKEIFIKENKIKIYGDNFTNFTFTNIALPNLQAADIETQVTLVPSWNIVQLP